MKRKLRDVYDPEQQSYRVEFAAQFMLRGYGAGNPNSIYGNTRKFDTCFEMNDGDQVAARLWRRALKNPKLMAAFPTYLSVERAKEGYERIFGTAR